MYKCIRKCFVDRVYAEGEQNVADSVALKAPKNFELMKGIAPVEPEPVNEPKTFLALAVEEAKSGDDKHVLVRMKKDDLIAKAAEMGLSVDNDLVNMNKDQIADLIVEKQIIG